MVAAMKSVKSVKSVKPVKSADADIRKDLPVAVKGGTSAKPVWTINGSSYRFVSSVKRSGLSAKGKVRLGANTVLAKYKVLTPSHTVKNGVLWFVGVFAKAK